MDLSTETLAQIERYITHQLPDDQCQQIEKRMKEDPQFHEAVEALRRSRSFLDRAVRLDEATQARLIDMSRAIINQLDAQLPVSQSVPAPIPRPKTRRIGLWSFAMAAILFLISGVYLLVSPIQLANADLDAGMHRDALSAPTNALRPAERQALDDFLTANALYTNGEFEKAIALYERAANAPVSPYLKEAIWYNLALACMKADNLPKAHHYWSLYENTLDQPHYPSSLLDRTRIRTRLLWQEIFA